MKLLLIFACLETVLLVCERILFGDVSTFTAMMVIAQWLITLNFSLKYDRK
jgi:hypothetical protein